MRLSRPGIEVCAQWIAARTSRALGPAVFAGDNVMAGWRG